MNSNQNPHGTKVRVILSSIVGASILVILTLVWLTDSTTAKANSTDFANITGQYPTINGSAISSCSLCHTGSIPALNPFGTDYKNNGRSVAALIAIQNLDSDNDGYSNIVEINAHTFPGDPGSHPVAAPTATKTNVPPTAVNTQIPPTATKTPVPNVSSTPGPKTKPTSTKRPPKVQPTKIHKTKTPRMTRTAEPDEKSTTLPPQCLTKTPGSEKGNGEDQNKACASTEGGDGEKKGDSGGFLMSLWSGITLIFGGHF